VSSARLSARLVTGGLLAIKLKDYAIYRDYYQSRYNAKMQNYEVSDIGPDSLYRFGNAARLHQAIVWPFIKARFRQTLID
jgi:hypothetical protein